jgi:hypothetical protein
MLHAKYATTPNARTVTSNGSFFGVVLCAVDTDVARNRTSPNQYYNSIFYETINDVKEALQFSSTNLLTTKQRGLPLEAPGDLNYGNRRSLYGLLNLSLSERFDVRAGYQIRHACCFTQASVRCCWLVS